ncbi:MAG: SRPBCC family protein [Gemmatimonadota bacterium]|nr:SRPBCC family protein [Gemmatimonadota bacterium]
MATNTIEIERTPGGTLEISAADGRSGSGANGAQINVGSVERWASLLGGGALVVRGLSRGGGSGIAAALLGGALVQRGATGHCQVYGGLGIDSSEQSGRATEGGMAGLLGGTREVRVESVATVNRPAAELYRFWRDAENLPRFMTSLESVQPESDHRARWTLKPAVGPTVDFDAEITHEAEGEHIAWRSADSALVEHTGEVRFRELPNGRGTEVRMKLDFTPPGGVIGAGIAKLFDGATEMQLRNDLKRFKQLMETGEIATTEGQSAGADRD